MSRYRASAIHVGISLAIFAVIMWVILAVWYPSFFFGTDGGWQGIRLMFLVDVVLGPLLTLVVFKSGKPGLKFDLGAIACAQVLALAGGLWVVHDERPLALVYVDGQFFSVSKSDFAQAHADASALDKIPGRGPKWVAVDLPDDPAAQSDIRAKMLKTDVPLRMLTSRWVPFDPVKRLTTDAFVERDLEVRDPGAEQRLRWIARQGGSFDDYRFYPYGARYTYGYLGCRLSTHECVGILDVTPSDPDRPS